jgi:C4-dicarboxylate-specific signal transduction histidine kinase
VPRGRGSGGSGRRVAVCRFEIGRRIRAPLIINAIEAMSDLSDGPRDLVISTSRAEPAGAEVAVRDTGPGVAPAALERIFEAFHTTKPGGLGRGLSVCRSIIEANGGSSGRAQICRAASSSASWCLLTRMIHCV